MRVALAWLLGLIICAPLVTSAGVIGVSPTVQVDDAIGASYRFRVEAQEGRDYGKILFMAHSLYGPTTCTGASCPQHQIEALISNSSHVPQTGDCCWDGTGVRPQPPVCADYNAAPWSGLKVGAWIGDKDAPVGLWLSDSTQWPRRALGIDGSPSAFKLEATYQRDITGLDGQITWRRGDLLPADDTRSWGRACLPMMLNRSMRQWHVTVIVGDQSFHGTAIYPDNEATYLRPDRLVEFVTEFFEFPGTVRIFVWDIVAESEQRGSLPLREWTIIGRHPSVPVGYWGVRTTSYADHPALEFGTSPSVTYVSEPGTRLSLHAPVSVPALGMVASMTMIGALLVRLLRSARV